MSLFRSEVLAERADAPRWGAVIIARAPALGWASLGLLAIALVGLVLVLSLEYAKKVRVSGYLEPKGGIAEVLAPAAGTLAAMRVSEGRKVASGQVLAVLSHDRRTQDGRLAEAEEAGYLQASLARLQERMAADSARHAADQRALQRDIGHLGDEQDALKEQVRLADGQAVLQRQAEARLERLMTQGLIAGAAYDQERRSTLAAAQSQSQAQRALVANQRQLAQVREALARLHREHAARRLELEQEQADLARQLARLAERRQTAVVAPKGGIVSFVQFRLGDRVAAEQVLMTVTEDAQATDLVLLADANAAADLSVGDEVRFKALSGQRRRSRIGIAQVRELSKAPQKPYQLRSWVQVPGAVFRARAEVFRFPDGEPLRSGMTVDAFVVTKSRTLWRWLLEPLTSALEGL